MIRSSRLPWDEACLLVLVAIDLARQTANPRHHLSILCRRHFGDWQCRDWVVELGNAGKARYFLSDDGFEEPQEVVQRDRGVGECAG